MPAPLKIQLTESEEQELLELSHNPKIPKTPLYSNGEILVAKVRN